MDKGHLCARIMCFVGSVLLVFNLPAAGCSITGCSNNGIAVRSTFTVQLNHHNQPLPGASIRITGEKIKEEIVMLSDEHGKALIKGLQPGTYWITTEYMGIGAGQRCFHVAPGLRRGKRKLLFSWGEMPYGVTHLAGTIYTTIPGPDKNPLWALAHSRPAPLPDAAFVLTSVETGAAMQTTSNANGKFGVPTAGPGEYVLNVRSESYSGVFLLEVSPRSSTDSLVLRKQMTGCGESISLDN